MLTESEKQRIAESTRKYVEQYGSQNAAANSLKGVSSATLSQINNQNWELIKDSMWRNIAAQIGHSKITWVHAHTTNFNRLHKFLADAQDESMVFAVIGPAGSGKSATLEYYNNEQPNTYLIQCNDYWNKKLFLSELLNKMGKDHNGLSVAQMMNTAVQSLKKKETPLIIIDEVDKLPDHVLYFFITLYNRLEDYCGFVLIATAYLKTRIERGIRLNKKGYDELYSRMGRKFIELDRPNSTDIMSVCMVNGIKDKPNIKNIVEDSFGDLRRVKKKITGIKKDQLNAA